MLSPRKQAFQLVHSYIDTDEFCETVWASHMPESVRVCSIFAESKSVTFALNNQLQHQEDGVEHKVVPP